MIKYNFMRNELKFKSNYQYLKELIIISDYTKHYPSRHINSIYFDDVDLSLFKQSEEGNVPRFKLRYRWYGKQTFSSEGNLEKKITYEQFRDKKIKKIKNCKFNKLSHLINSEFGFYFNPIIKVQYLREYFIHSNGNRVTLDSNIKFLKLSENVKTFDEAFEDDSIMEFKIDITEDENKIFQQVHNLRTRYSKYCEGVKKLNQLA